MDRASRLIGIFCDDDTFTRGKAIGLDNDRPVRTFDDAVSIGRRGAFDELGSWNVVRFKELLRKAFARLEACLIRSRTDHRQIVSAKYVDNALAQGEFGSDERYIDSLILGEVCESCDIISRKRNQLRMFGNATVAGRCENLGDF